MRIFVTGAPGFIGSALVPELIQAGHQVLGLTRSEAGAERLRAAGAEVLRGNIEDLDSLREGAAKSDGVVHLAFNHDFSQFQKNCDDDRKAIEAIGEVLLGSNRPFVITSGTAMAANVDGKPSTEDAIAVPEVITNGRFERKVRGEAERKSTREEKAVPGVQQDGVRDAFDYQPALASEHCVALNALVLWEVNGHIAGHHEAAGD